MELHTLLDEINSVKFESEFNLVPTQSIDLIESETDAIGLDESDIEKMNAIADLSKERLLATDSRNRSPLYSAIISNEVARVKELLSNFALEQLELLNALYSRSVDRGEDWVQPRVWMQQITESQEMYQVLSKAYHAAELANPINRGMRYLPLERRLALKHHGLTDLMIAAIEGYEKTLLEILSEDSREVLKVDRQGWNALMHAIHHGKISNARHLLQYEQRRQLLQYDTSSGLNAFTIAIINQQFNVVRGIVEMVRGSHATLRELMLSRDCQGRTPLIIACQMLKKFPRENTAKFAPSPDSRRLEIKHEAEALSSVNAMIEFLVANSSLEVLIARDYTERSALYHSIRNTQIHQTRMLLSRHGVQQIKHVEQELRGPIHEYLEASIANLQKNPNFIFPDMSEAQKERRNTIILKECGAMLALMRQVYQKFGLIKAAEASESNAILPQDSPSMSAMSLSAGLMASLPSVATRTPMVPPAIVVRPEKSQQKEKEESRVVLSPIATNIIKITKEERELTGVFLSVLAQNASQAQTVSQKTVTATKRKKYDDQPSEAEVRSVKNKIDPDQKAAVMEKQSRSLFSTKLRQR